ncbi:MAG: N-acetylmuramoyl-L-alanine amidase [Candidatus Bilamarchaeaceae archaeon]
MSYPKGAIVHFTAGRWRTEQNARDSFGWLQSQGFKAVVISRLGNVYFPRDWDRTWGPHAGRSFHPALGSDVSKHCVGFELVNPGRLTLQNGRWVTWYGETIESELVVHYQTQVGNIKPGGYVRFSDLQIEALITILFNLKKRYTQFSFDYVLGHDEVAPDRKNDPGGALGMPMDEFRDLLKQRYYSSINPIT